MRTMTTNDILKESLIMVVNLNYNLFHNHVKPFSINLKLNQNAIGVVHI